MPFEKHKVIFSEKNTLVGWGGMRKSDLFSIETLAFCLSIL